MLACENSWEQQLGVVPSAGGAPACFTITSIKTHSVTVKGVEDSWDVAAEDADGDPSVVQRQPAPTRLL